MNHHLKVEFRTSPEFEKFDDLEFGLVRNSKSKIEKTKVEGDEAISQVAFYGSDVFLKEMQTGKKRPVGSNRHK